MVKSAKAKQETSDFDNLLHMYQNIIGQLEPKVDEFVAAHPEENDSSSFAIESIIDNVSSIGDDESDNFEIQSAQSE